MECPICSFEFDNDKKTPILCICGNSICKECIQLLVDRNNRAFICPLCRYIRNPYKNNPLPVNTQIVKLMLEVDVIRYPFKEKESITEPLIVKSVDIQSEGNVRPKEFNEYVSLIGIVAICILTTPWV